MSITLNPQFEAEVISHGESVSFADLMDVLTWVPHPLEKMEQRFADLH